MPALFSLGKVVITANAQQTLHPEDVPIALRRHASGDWGDLCPDDWKQNELAMIEGHRLFSRYCDRLNVPFYIITEHDFSVTTILLPEDY